jgi:outer membrane protein assembly factor BamA
VWSFDLKLLSPFGTGREIAVRSERREKGRRQLDVSYRQPVYLAGPGDLALSLATRDYRDDFYEFGAGVRFSTHLSGRMTTGLRLGWKRVTPADDQRVYSAYSVEYSIERNSLDHPLNPANGLLLQMSLAYTHRRQASSVSSAPDTVMSAGGERFNETRSNLTAELYRNLVGRLVGHLSLGYIGLESDDNLPPVSELALIGGPGTLRGYRNEQFAAQRALLGTVEPRLRFRPGYLFVFYDAAYLNRRLSSDGDDTVTEELYRDAAGIGLALLDQYRSVKLSLGWNTDAAFDQPRLSIELRSDL